MKQKKEEIKKLKKEKIDLMLFLLFCFLTLTFTIGYSALNTELKISGEAVYRVQADIRITDVSFSEGTYANENYNSKYSKDQVNLGVTLTSLDSSIKYKVTVTNIGNVNKIISEPEFVSNNENITYEFVPVEGTSKLIESGTTKEFYIIIKYKAGITLAENKTADISIKLIFDNESILAQGNSSSSSSTFFNSGPITKAQVETITFSSTKKVGDNAIGSWDASYNKDNSVIAWYTDNDNNGLYELTISGNEIIYFPQNSGSLFDNFTNLTSIDFTSINTSNTIYMYSMFYKCSSLMSLDLSNFDTSNVLDMRTMFFNCSNLTSLNLNSFDTSKVTDMSLMFNRCSSIAILDLSNFNTSNVIYMSAMFTGCYNLINLNLSSFNTSKVMDMSGLFQACTTLENLNLSNFNTSNVSNMSTMFSNCFSLININIDNFVTSNVTNMSAMFDGCSSLTNLDLSNFDTSNVTDMTYMFSSCSGLETLNLSSFTNQILRGGDAITITDWMFSSCTSLSELHLEKWDFLCEGGNALDINGIPASATVYVSQDQTENFIGFLNPTFTVIGV